MALIQKNREPTRKYSSPQKKPNLLFKWEPHGYTKRTLKARDYFAILQNFSLPLQMLSNFSFPHFANMNKKS